MSENVEKKIPVEVEDDDFDMLDLDLGEDVEESETLVTADDTDGEADVTQEDQDDTDDLDNEEDKSVELSTKPKVESKSKEARLNDILKKEIVKLQMQNKELQVAQERKLELTKAEDLKAKYLKDGYSEEEAIAKAQSDLRQAKLEEKIDLFEFQMNNATVLAKYPKAKDEVSRIMSIAKISKMSAEQVCRGLYGDEVPEREKRAKDTVLGKTSNNSTDTTIASSTRSAEKPTASSLTESERRFKTKIERMFLDGEKMSDADYIRKYRK